MNLQQTQRPDFITVDFAPVHQLDDSCGYILSCRVLANMEALANGVFKSVCVFWVNH